MYTVYSPSGTIKNDLGVVIPQDQQDQSYKDYVTWLALRNAPTLAVDLAIAQRIVVTAFQIRKALNASGLRAQVESAVSASTNVTLQDGWHYAPYFYSDDSMALTMGAALGKSAANMYALYQLAASL